MRHQTPTLAIAVLVGLGFAAHNANAEHDEDVVCSAHLNCYEMGVTATDLSDIIEKHPDPHMGINLNCYAQAETPDELKKTVETAKQTDPNMGLSVQCYTSGK